MVSVSAEVENPDGELRPGQFVRVRVELPAVENVIALPQTAVVTSLYGDYVYLVEQAPAAAAAPAGGDDRRTAGAAARSDTGRSCAGEWRHDAPRVAARETRRARCAGRRPARNAPPPAARRRAKSSWRSRSSSRSAAGRAIWSRSPKGLEAGQTVVTSGQNKLTNNASIAINNDVDPAAMALDGAKQPQGAEASREFLRALHPPAGPDDRHLDPDPAARHPGVLQHDHPRISGGRGIGDHRHHRSIPAPAPA